MNSNGNGNMLGRKDPAPVRSLDQMVLNASIYRAEVLRQLLEGQQRDINKECGYPETLTREDYKALYDREGIANRIVRLYPDECWKVPPEIYEDEDAESETEFETAWKELTQGVNGRPGIDVLSYLHKVDELSGIGRFGVLLIGLDDGLRLDQPARGIGPDGAVEGDSVVDRKLLFLKAFDESLVDIKSFELNPNNPRFGLPVIYTIKLGDQQTSSLIGLDGQSLVVSQVDVHWTRVVHMADNRKSSEVFGVPRLQNVFNRVYDIRKILGADGEGFWKGGFPGYSFETFPGEDVYVNTEDVKAEVFNYMNRLQRYLVLQNMGAKTLGTQVADPSPHVRVQLEQIAITIDVPLRILMGSEQAQLASGQDRTNWNDRLSSRQVTYLTPHVIRPAVDRLIALRVLPRPAENYLVGWPDLNTPSDDDKASVAQKITDAVAKYMQSGADQLIPPMFYLTLILGFTQEEAEEIIEAAEERLEELNAEEEELNDETEQPPENGQPPQNGEQSGETEEEEQESATR